MWVISQKMYYIAQYRKNVARLYKKNVECGPRVKKVAHPCFRLTLKTLSELGNLLRSWIIYYEQDQ
jgi:hypothetical protein